MIDKFAHLLAYIFNMLCDQVDNCFVQSLQFYPTAYKGCAGIIFTHFEWAGVLAGQVAAGRKKFVWAVTMRCKRLILAGVTS